MEISKTTIKEAAIAHAKMVLGGKFKINSDEAQSIMADFLAGVEWIHEKTSQQLN